jgi:hypothetical protein
MYFLNYFVCDAIVTAATLWPIVSASGDSKDDCGEPDGM